MRKYSILFFFALLSTNVALAQHSQIYSSTDKNYAQGVELYMQGQFSASQEELAKYKGDNYREQTEFFLAADAFELRSKTAQKKLQQYLKNHAYTPYASETHFMLGALLIEKNKNKQAIKEFDQVKENELFRNHAADYLFLCGYAHLQMSETQRASTYFYRLKNQKSKYTLQARYYYAFTQYTLQNYGKALPEFLAIEHTQQYKDIVPYYIIQIYYAGGQYDEVYERAEYLLSNQQGNENNQELHRMLGEIYYQEEQYNKAIEHLSTYEKNCQEQKKELVREDMYLLAMSYYQTNQYKEAATYFNKVSKQNDALTESTCYHLGNCYHLLGNIDQAKLMYSAAIGYNITPKLREEAMYNYALTTYQSSTALGESVNAFTNFIEQYPDSKYKEEVYNLLSEAFMNSKNYASALEALNLISEPTTKMLETRQALRYRLGTDAYMQNKLGNAIDWFTAVIDTAKVEKISSAEISKYVTESYFLRAESYARQAKYDQAQADLQSFKSQPNAAKSSNYELSDYSMGYTLFSQKKYTESLPYFNVYVSKADKESATYADALNRIGDCYFNNRDFVKAETYYAKVIALGSTGSDYAMFQRGYALGLMKRYSDKITALENLAKNYPKSDYADDALYEIARAELQRDRDDAAIDAYERLLKTYPNSNLARKAALEKAMIFFNKKDYANAIESYKQVIKNYPGSEEAYSALDGLEATYVETNNISEYLAFTKQLGRINMKSDSKEDSLTYITAERQYIIQNYQQAVAGLAKYISQYCSGGRYCTQAQYFIADSYYQLGQKAEARQEYEKLCQITGNPYMQEALTKVAEISYDEKNYDKALQYFRRLQLQADNMKTVNIARLGVLRSSYYLNDNVTTINVASEIIDDVASTEEVLTEARYNRAKAYLNMKEYQLAIEDLNLTANQVRTWEGAESKFLLAQAYFEQAELDKAEEQIMSFASMNTQQQYWLARSFILLSDIYVKKSDDFQAKQYLLSLRSNYHNETDDILSTVAQKLQLIEEREKEKLNQQNDDDE